MMQITDQDIKQTAKQATPKSNRLIYLDSLKYIFCLMIFWTHFTGVFWTMCEVKPDLRAELQALFHPPFSILVDSNLALYGFCILSGYLAAHKKIKDIRDLFKQFLVRYIRFVIPFFFINLLVFITYYTLGFPTQISSQLLHNAWVGTYYNHAPTVAELIKSSLTMSGDLNGPLWMMKYIFGGTCLIYVYNFLRQSLSDRITNTHSGDAVYKAMSAGVQGKTFTQNNKQRFTVLDIFDVICMAAVFFTFSHLPEPNFFHLLLVLLGVTLRHVDEAIKDTMRLTDSKTDRPKSEKEFKEAGDVSNDSSSDTSSGTVPVKTGSNTIIELFFLLIALIPVFLDAGGLNRILHPFFSVHLPALAPYFIWNTYWVMGFSFFLILGVMNCTILQKLLDNRILRILAPTNFSVYLIHFPLITCFSLKLYILMVNRISYSKEFMIIAVATFIMLFVCAYIYDVTIGKLQNRLQSLFIRFLYN